MKVGVIGASFAKAAYLPALRHVEGAQVAAIASARMESAQATADEFGIPAAYDDWRAMLDNHDLDLVCIATPTDTHCDMALAAIERGAAVLCEKPTAMNGVEARRMLDAASAAGVVHMIDHELRFNPNRRKARDMIRDGKLGKIRHLSIVNISPSWGDPGQPAQGRLVVAGGTGRRAAGRQRLAPDRPGALVAGRGRRGFGPGPDHGARADLQDHRRGMDRHGR